MDLVDTGRYFGALLAVLGLLGAAYAAARVARSRFSNLSDLMGARAAPTGARASVTQTVMLDARRRLIVARFDAREHLILLGAQGETVIATADAPPAAAPVQENAA